jgi:hypothetical protein
VQEALADLGRYDDHALSVGARTPEAVMQELLARRERGDFRLL